jgi:hypothetical protein
MVIAEYLRTMDERKQQVDGCLHEFLFQILARRQKYNQLHQLLQHCVIQDSIKTAQRMISLSNVYPPFYQLGLDMYKRLERYNLIIDTMIEHGEVRPTCCY